MLMKCLGLPVKQDVYFTMADYPSKSQPEVHLICSPPHFKSICQLVHKARPTAEVTQHWAQVSSSPPRGWLALWNASTVMVFAGRSIQCWVVCKLPKELRSEQILFQMTSPPSCRVNCAYFLLGKGMHFTVRAMCWSPTLVSGFDICGLRVIQAARASPSTVRLGEPCAVWSPFLASVAQRTGTSQDREQGHKYGVRETWRQLRTEELFAFVTEGNISVSPGTAQREFALASQHTSHWQKGSADMSPGFLQLKCILLS